MPRSVWLRLCVLILLAIVGAVVVAHAVLPPSPIYSVSQIVTGLRQRPRAWVGRTVQVRGDMVMLAVTSPSAPVTGVETTASCLSQRCAMTPPVSPGARLQVIMVDDGPPLSAVTRYELERQATFNVPPSLDPSLVPHLLLRAQPPAANGMLAALHRLPLVGSWIPTPALALGQVAGVYRIRILSRRPSPVRCTLGVWCDDAVVLGALSP